MKRTFLCTSSPVTRPLARNSASRHPASSLIFKTRWGWMGVAASGERISSIVLPCASKSQVQAKLGSRSVSNGTGQVENALLREASEQLTDYLSGGRRAIGVPVAMEAGSPFARRVWREVLRIPYGRVRSYAWVASRVGGARYARAVGRALGANPVPIVVPCHRVVSHDASLGGFSGGLAVKRRLLQLEGVLPQLRQS